MPRTIDRDMQRFKQIVRGKVRRNVRKYITHGEMIGRMERLEALSLRGTRAGDAGLEFLTGLKYLHVLDVSETRVKGHGLAVLKKALPHLVVRRAR